MTRDALAALVDSLSPEQWQRLYQLMQYTNLTWEDAIALALSSDAGGLF